MPPATDKSGKDDPRGLLLDFGGVISITLFERHRTTERLLGLREGALDWRVNGDRAMDDCGGGLVHGFSLVVSSMTSW